MSNYIGDITKPEQVNFSVDNNLAEPSKIAMEQVNADWESIRKSKFIADHKVKLSDDDITIFSKPRSGCSHCYGTGVEGAYTINSTRLPGQPAICRCLTNKLVNHPESLDTNRLTYGEFKDLMAKARLRHNLKEPEHEKMDANTPEGTDQENSTGRNEIAAG